METRKPRLRSSLADRDPSRSEADTEFHMTIMYRELRDEPEFKRLVSMYEADMDRQREEAYELLGISP